MAAATVLGKMYQQEDGRGQGLGPFGGNDDVDCDDASVLTEVVKAFRFDARALCRLCGAVVSELSLVPAGARPTRGRGRCNDGMLEAILVALDIHLRAAATSAAAATNTDGDHSLMLSVLAVSGCLDALTAMVQQAVDNDDQDVGDRVRQTVLLKVQQSSTPTVNHVSLWLPEAFRLAAMLLTGNATTTTMTSSYAGSHSSHGSDNDISSLAATPNSSSSSSSSSATGLSSSLLSSFATMISSGNGTTKMTTMAGGSSSNNNSNNSNNNNYNNDSTDSIGQTTNNSVTGSQSSGSVWTWGKAMMARGMGGLRNGSGSHSIGGNNIGATKSKDGAVFSPSSGGGTGVVAAASSSSATSSLRQLVALALARSVCRICAMLLTLATDTDTATATTTTTTTTTGGGEIGAPSAKPTSMSTLSLSGMLGEQGVVELLLVCLGVASQRPLATTAVATSDWEERRLLEVCQWAVYALSLMVDSPSCGSPPDSTAIDSSSSSEVNVRRMCFSQRSGSVLISALQVAQHHQQQQRGISANGSVSGCGVINVLSVMLAMVRQRDHSKMGLLRLLGGNFTGMGGSGSGAGVSESTRLLCRLLVRALHRESVAAIAAEGHAQVLGLDPVSAAGLTSSDGSGDEASSGDGELTRAREALLMSRVSLLLPISLVAVFVEQGGLPVCGALGRCGNAVRLVGTIATVYVLPQATRAVTALVAHVMTTATTMTTATAATHQPQSRSPSPSPSPTSLPTGSAAAEATDNSDTIDAGIDSSSINFEIDQDNDNDNDNVRDGAAMDPSDDMQMQGPDHGAVMPHHHHRLRRLVVGGDAIRRVVVSTTSAGVGVGAAEREPPLPLPLDGFDCLLTLVAQLCLALRCFCLDSDNKDRLATATVASSSSSSSNASDNAAAGAGVGGNGNNNDSSQTTLQQTPTKQPAPALGVGGRPHAGKGLLEALLHSLNCFRLTAESSALFLSEAPPDNNDNDTTNNNNDNNKNNNDALSSNSRLWQVQRLCVTLRRLTDEAAATITVLREAQLSSQQLRGGGMKSTSTSISISGGAGRASSILGSSTSSSSSSSTLL